MNMPMICIAMAAKIRLWPRGSFHRMLMYSGFMTVTAKATKTGSPQSSQAERRELVVKVFRSPRMRKRSRIV
jgi:hypothetical protein